MSNVTLCHLQAIDYMNAAANYRRSASRCAGLDYRRKAWLLVQARDCCLMARQWVRRNRFYGHVLDRI